MPKFQFARDSIYLGPNQNKQCAVHAGDLAIILTWLSCKTITRKDNTLFCRYRAKQNNGYEVNEANG